MSEHDDGFYRELLDGLSDGVYLVDRDRTITYWNAGATRLAGYSADEVVGRRCRDGILNHVTEDGVELCGAGCPLKATMIDGKVREARVFMHHRDGQRQPVWVRASPIWREGKIVGAVEVFNDDTAMVLARQQVAELAAISMIDPLTQVGNRRMLDRALERALSDWSRHGEAFGILLVDIDMFKAVNDTFGHDVGDAVLTMVASSLSFGARPGDAVARFGGEEFAVVCSRATPESLPVIAERLRMLVASSRFYAGRQPVEVTVSIGAAMCAPGDDAHSIIRRADALLYQAKESGRNQVVCDVMSLVP